jgi:ferredoxin
MRYNVDIKKCTGHARCVATAPEVYQLDDDGYNVTEEGQVAAGFEDVARRGARSCPERAITIIE